MPFKSYWTLAFLIFTISRCFADDDHEMEEFLKREYSLSKPYQGMLSVIHSVLLIHSLFSDQITSMLELFSL